MTQEQGWKEEVRAVMVDLPHFDRTSTTLCKSPSHFLIGIALFLSTLRFSPVFPLHFLLASVTNQLFTASNKIFSDIIPFPSVLSTSYFARSIQDNTTSFNTTWSFKTT